MNTLTDETLHHIVRVIVREVQPEQVIMFGSRAGKSPGPDADLDLLVVQSEPFGRAHSRIREIARIERALSGVPVPTDILVYSRDEIERWRNEPGHVVAHAIEEGRVLYERVANLGTGTSERVPERDAPVPDLHTSALRNSTL